MPFTNVCWAPPLCLAGNWLGWKQTRPLPTKCLQPGEGDRHSNNENTWPRHILAKCQNFKGLPSDWLLTEIMYPMCRGESWGLGGWRELPGSWWLAEPQPEHNPAWLQSPRLFSIARGCPGVFQASAWSHLARQGREFTQTPEVFSSQRLQFGKDVIWRLQRRAWEEPALACWQRGVSWCVCVCVCVYDYFCACVNCVCLHEETGRYVYVCLCVYICLPLSLHDCIHLRVSVFICVSPCVFVCVWVCVSFEGLCVSELGVVGGVCLHMHLFASLDLHVCLWRHVCIFMSVWMCVYFLACLSVCVCLCVCVCVCEWLCVRVLLWVYVGWPVPAHHIVSVALI